MTIFRALLLVFLLVPIIEIYLLIKVGSWIGALPTVLLVIGTAVAGAFLVRSQGFYAWRRVELAMARGELPALPMMEGMMLLVAGALLLTPGFFTDAVGFLLLVPAVRLVIIQWFLRHSTVVPGAPHGPPRSGPRTIEGSYDREDDR